MSARFLSLELELLVLKYGRGAVVEALARLTDRSPDDVEREIANLAKKPSKSARRRDPRAAKNPAEDRMLEGRADIQRLLELYRAKLLLPTLRDVMSFLSAHGCGTRPKTREAALPKVIRVLSDLPADQLTKLERTQASSRDPEAFAQLAGELMERSDRR